MTAVLLKRVEALEASVITGPAVRVLLLGSTAAPGAASRLTLDGLSLVQGDDEPESAFRARAATAARQRPGQAVVLLDELDRGL